MSTAPAGGGGRNGEAKGIAAAITEVSERASTLVREEIELAKVEIAEKATRLAKGAIVAVVAGVFFLTALFFVLVGCAWLLYYYLPGNQFTYFWGFFAMALILVMLGAIAGLIAARAVKRGAPPTPDMAIAEARLIRETVAGETAAGETAGATTASASAPYGAAAPHAQTAQATGGAPAAVPGTGATADTGASTANPSADTEGAA